jgi:lipopolysaccharide exporter
MTGTAAGQGIALLLSPILTRLFDPADFSVFEQYALLLSVFTVVVTGKYEFAIMQPKSREDARHIAGLAMKIALYSCSVLLLMSVIPLLLSSSFFAEELTCWLWTLPIALFAMALFNVINFWFSREKNYKVAATSKLLYSASGEPLKILSGVIRPGVGGLILGTVAGHLAAAWYSWRKFIQAESKAFRDLSKERMKELAREHRDYPRFAIWGGILNNLAQWAHVAVFIFFYGEKALIPIGFIALSRRIFFNPLGILSSSYGQVFYQRISEIESSTELRSFYVKNFLRFLLFASVLVVVIQVLPANTLGIVFGEKWTDALIYLKILSYWYALNFVISTLSFIFYRLRLQWYTLVADITHFIVVIAAFWWAHANGLDEIGAVKAMVWAKVIYLVLNCCAVIYFLNRNIKQPGAVS